MSEFPERCKNCSQHLLLHQKFCHSCGQKTATHRIDFHYLLHEIPHSVFHVDGGILFTLKELFTRPGHTIREYLQGRRQPHFKPFMLVLILGSLCALLQLKGNRQTGTATVESELPEVEKAAARYVDLQAFLGYIKEILSWLSEHFAFTLLLILPVIAWSFYLGFRKYSLNYPEWLVIFLFLAGQSLALYLFVLLLQRFDVDARLVFFLVVVGMTTFSLTQLFEKQGKLHVILRSFWSFLLSYFLSVVYITIIVIILLTIGLMRFGTEELLPAIMKPAG